LTGNHCNFCKVQVQLKRMRLLFVADGRSPIALNWIEYFLDRGHEVHLASTFDCPGDERLASLNVVPVAFSQLKTAAGSRRGGTAETGRVWKSAGVRLRTLLRQWLGPLTLPRAARSLQEVIAWVEPELVHAMRIPYEGMLAALAQPRVPLLVSTWGNDFTLHAPSTPLMRHYTRRALQRADALHSDCYRDQRLARAWGFAAHKPAVVLPGAGGVQPELFYPTGEELPNEDNSTVINPRGFRAYVRNETFFRSIPSVLAEQPRAHFVCPTMAGEPQARRWLDELGIAGHVELLPTQSRPQMAELFRQARVAVSPSLHDGTPNTLLEAMACGCVPVAFDGESLREWIVPGLNGLLVEPDDPDALAQVILLALREGDLCRRARAYNARLIAERASYPLVMSRAEDFYRELLGEAPAA
jgi:glycosyltransferase involved in cell wall biosynthesis